MTTTWEVLEGRGLNVERLAGKGWNVEPGRDGGEVLAIPFVSKGVVAGEKFRRFPGSRSGPPAGSRALSPTTPTACAIRRWKADP